VTWADVDARGRERPELLGPRVPTDERGGRLVDRSGSPEAESG